MGGDVQFFCSNIGSEQILYMRVQKLFHEIWDTLMKYCLFAKQITPCDLHYELPTFNRCSKVPVQLFIFF
jgi:hypothetical protein